MALLQPPGSLPADADLLEVRRWIARAANWMFSAYETMGKSTGTSPLSISGNAATASTANGVQVVMNAGNPEGNQQASPGVFYIDTDTNTVYVKSANDDATGWQVL